MKEMNETPWTFINFVSNNIMPVAYMDTKYERGFIHVIR